MATCYICETEITKANKYKEHIILNAIGGKLKSSELICLNCSRLFDPIDNSIDAGLAKQLNPITCELNVERERDDQAIQAFNAVVVETGEKIKIMPGGKREIAHQSPTLLPSGGYSFRVTSLKVLKQQVKGIARKENISVDVDEFIKDVEDKIKEGKITTQEYLKSPVEYEMPSGDELFFRSISKMAVKKN